MLSGWYNKTILKPFRGSAGDCGARWRLLFYVGVGECILNYYCAY